MIAEHGFGWHVVTVGAKGCVTFRRDRVREFRDFLEIDARLGHLHWLMQHNGGVFLPPWGKVEQWLLSVQHDADDVDRFAANFARFADSFRGSPVGGALIGARAGDGRRHPAATAGQVVRRGARRDGYRSGHSGRPVLFAAGAVGLREDDDAADDRRVREARLRPHRTRRPRRSGRSAAQAAGQHGLPDLCTVSVHDGVGQRRVRLEVPEGVARRGQAPCRRSAGTGSHERLFRSAVRRSCPAVNSSGSRWRGHWCCGRACCCSTSRSVRWTRSCASSCSWSCARCSARSASRSCT